MTDINAPENAWRLPKLQWIRANTWRVLENYSYITDAGRIIIIDAGFETDGVSSPRALWPLIPATGDAFPAGIVHDFLYSTHPAGMSRRDCDRVLWEACRRLGIDQVFCDAIYAAVRLGGEAHW